MRGCGRGVVARPFRRRIGHGRASCPRADRDERGAPGSPPGRASLGTAGLPVSGIAPGRWVVLPQAPTSRGEVSAARIGDDVYVVGGFNAAGQSSSVVQRLNLRTQHWTAVAPMPEALNHMSAVSFGGRLYVVGGYGGPGDTSTGAVRGFWRYDPRRAVGDDARRARGPRGSGSRRPGPSPLRRRRATTMSTAPSRAWPSLTSTPARWTLGPSLSHSARAPRRRRGGRRHLGAGGRALGLGSFTYASATRRARRRGGRCRRCRCPVGFEAGVRPPRASSSSAARSAPRPWARWIDWTCAPLAGAGWPNCRWRATAWGWWPTAPLVFAIDGGPQAGLTMSRTVSRLRVA